MPNPTLVKYVEDVLVGEGFTQTDNRWIKKEDNLEFEIRELPSHVLCLTLIVSGKVIGSMYVDDKEQINDAMKVFERSSVK